MELQDIRSKDWSISLAGAGQIVEGLEDIKQCVRIILATQKGSDPLRPSFGVDVMSYLDLPDNRVATELTREIIEQIGLWEPRVVIEKITYKLSPGRVSFAIEWKLTANSQTVITNIDYGDPANGASNNVVPPPTQKAGAPTFTPISGSYAGFVAVVIQSSTPGAIIRYTTDGSVPNDLSTLYTGPVIRASDTVIRARAYADAFLPSNISTIAYDVVQYATEILTAPGTYLGEVLVEVISNSIGVEIRYTLDGSEPTISSPLYVAGILLSTSATVKTRAFNPPGGSASAAVATFTIKSLAPSISPDEGVFETSRLITMTNPNPIGSIYYTLDGSEPTESSTLYEGPFTLTQNADIRARVISPLNIPSDIAEADILIQVATPTSIPDAGAVEAGDLVELECSTPDATIHYTTNGSTPTTSSPVYSTPIIVNETTTIKAIAVKAGCTNSDVFEGVFIVPFKLMLACQASTTARIYRSFDDGVRWDEIQPIGNATASWRIVRGFDNGSAIFAMRDGFNILYRSADKGATWQQITSPNINGFAIPTAINPTNVNLNKTLGIQRGVNGSKMLMIGNNSNAALPRLFLSTNSGATFTAIAISGVPNQDVVHAGVAANGWLVVATNSLVDTVTTSNGIYLSKNDGASWTKVYGTSDANAFSHGVYCTNDGKVYVPRTTSSGSTSNKVVYSDNNGDSFITVNQSGIDFMDFGKIRLYGTSVGALQFIRYTDNFDFDPLGLTDVNPMPSGTNSLNLISAGGDYVMASTSAGGLRISSDKAATFTSINPAGSGSSGWSTAILGYNE